MSCGPSGRRAAWHVRLLAAGVVLAACAEGGPERAAEAPPADSQPSCAAPGARQVVERFGKRLQRVSLLAPEEVVAQEIRDAYASLVTPSLLASWLAEPSRAPGRMGSSPWPERIEVRSVEAADEGMCRVEGDVIYLTSVELVRGGKASREHVTLLVQGNGKWRIRDYETAAHTVPAE